MFRFSFNFHSFLCFQRKNLLLHNNIFWTSCQFSFLYHFMLSLYWMSIPNIELWIFFLMTSFTSHIYFALKFKQKNSKLSKLFLWKVYHIKSKQKIAVLQKKSIKFSSDRVKNLFQGFFWDAWILNK